MNLLACIIVGVIVGWLTSCIMLTEKTSNVMFTVALGIIGAILGAWLISPMVGMGSINQEELSIGLVFVSLVAASILMFIAYLMRRGAVRW
jgi:uncharacterized membrane protein YeaQ/YmgE (transglycosylase-associated protein family)